MRNVIRLYLLSTFMIVLFLVTASSLSAQNPTIMAHHLSPQSDDRDSILNDEEAAYWSFGATIGTPGGLNLVLARNFTADFGLRFSAGYALAVTGGEVDVVYRVAGQQSVRHALFAGVGWMGLFQRIGNLTREIECIGGGYNLQAGGFDFMLGLTYTTGYYSGLLPVGQIGYVHRFR